MKKYENEIKIIFKHKCEYDIKLDIPMDNNTNFLISQCICGEMKIDRVHRESEVYENILREKKEFMK